jgi:arsenate reductase
VSVAWIGRTHRTHHNFDDPSKGTDDPEMVMASYRRIRDQIKAFSREFIEQNVPV